jgi:murein DD-endopeptidase MepM/ murein hydrolase activator NlpD
MTSTLTRGIGAALLAACLLAVASDPAPVAAADRDRSPGHGTLAWPAAGRLTQKFGCTGVRLNVRRGRCSFFHNGVDVANRGGTRIHAAARGVVRYVGWDPYARGRDRAWVVIISHGGGLRTWYAHLRPWRVARARVGDRVRRGQLIGYMGKTGRATGVHVHFMAEYKGDFVNPRRFLPRGAVKPPRPGRSRGASRHGAPIVAASPGALPV